MKLHELANLLQVHVESATVLVVVHHLVMVKLGRGQKVKKPVAVAVFVLVLKVDKLHCSVVFQTDLQTRC